MIAGSVGRNATQYRLSFVTFFSSYIVISTEIGIFRSTCLLIASDEMDTQVFLALYLSVVDSCLWMANFRSISSMGNCGTSYGAEISLGVARLLRLADKMSWKLFSLVGDKRFRP